MLSQTLVPFWNTLTDIQQLEIAQAALRTAVTTVSRQIDELAREIDAGTLPDRGGAEALRLLAELLRLSVDDAGGHLAVTVGNA